MTGLVVIDESGDLGSAGSRFFVMASIIAPSSRHLSLPASKIPTGKNEYKFVNTAQDKTHDILKSLSISNISINYVAVDKNNPADHKFMYGNALYKRTLAELIGSSLAILSVKDVNIVVDGNRFVSIKELQELSRVLTSNCDKNLKKCYKGISHNEPCIQLADYVVGSVRKKYENNDDSFFNDIEDRISIARRY